MQKMYVPVNPILLQWVRKESGLSREQVAARAKISPLRATKHKSEITPGARLDLWEKGEGAPSFNQLKNLAKAYRRPLITFFLPHPPQRNEFLADLRSAHNSESSFEPRCLPS